MKKCLIQKIIQSIVEIYQVEAIQCGGDRRLPYKVVMELLSTPFNKSFPPFLDSLLDDSLKLFPSYGPQTY